jgi:hypothetical protein
MKKILPIIGLAILASCTAETEKSSEKKEQVKTELEEVIAPEVKIDMTLHPILEKDLSPEMTFEDEFISADSWDDKMGHNVLIRSAIIDAIEKDPEQDDRDFYYGKVHAYHYIVSADGKATLLWDMNDSERQCDFDLSIGFVAKDLIISDKDKNDIAETSIVYAKACRSDVSPANMKVIMHEGEKKFGLRGVMVDILPDNNTPRAIDDLDFSKHNFDVEDDNFDYFNYFGRYENEKDFDGAPDSFLQHGKEIWMKHSVLDHKF